MPFFQSQAAGTPGPPGPPGPAGPSGPPGSASSLILYLDTAGGAYTNTPIAGELLRDADTGSKTTITGSVTNSTQHVASFITPSDYLEKATIDTGYWLLHLYAFGSTAASYYFDISYVDPDGVSNKTLIQSGVDGATFLTSGQQMTSNSIYIPTTVLPSVNKRIVLDLYVTATGGNRSFTFEFRDGTLSHIHTPLPGPNIILDALEDVAIDTPANEDTIQYESATSLWKNKKQGLSALQKNLLQRAESGIETMDRLFSTSSYTLGPARSLYMSFFTAPENITVDEIQTFYTLSGAAGTTYAAMGIYEYNTATNSVTLLGATANDVTLWSTVTGTSITEATRPLTAPLSLTQGTRYAVGVMWIGSGTAPNIIANQSVISPVALFGTAPAMAGFKVGSPAYTSLPASATAVSAANRVFYARVIP